LLEVCVLPAIAVPTYIVDFPSELGLSARPRPEDPRVSLRAELYFPGGWELAHLYENLTEPGPLRERLTERRRRRVLNGYPDVSLDEGLLGSAALGMPPMAGLAIGVDRLLMVVLGEAKVGEGLLFAREGFEEPLP
jgi:lysyl-tRNA synthetase class 2